MSAYIWCSKNLKDLKAPPPCEGMHSLRYASGVGGLGSASGVSGLRLRHGGWGLGLGVGVRGSGSRVSGITAAGEGAMDTVGKSFVFSRREGFGHEELF